MIVKTTLIILSIISVLGSQANATRVKNCDGSANPDTTAVNITSYEEPPCTLRKNTYVVLTEKFTPDRDIAELTTKAWFKKWMWMGLPSSIHGASACDKIFLAADDSPASCPLKKGVTYIYKHSLFMDPLIPSISTTLSELFKIPMAKTLRAS